MKLQNISKLDRTLAKICVNCPLCRNARQRQKGLTFWLTKNVESKACPFCLAYERVYGHKAHEPLGRPASSRQT